jgi:hypothetical protein
MRTGNAAKTLESGDRPVLRGGDGHRAGADGIAVHDHGTRAALSETAAKLRTMHADVIAQHIEQRCRRVDIDDAGCAVYSKGDSGHVASLSRVRRDDAIALRAADRSRLCPIPGGEEIKSSAR